jgi:hypothetical protein
MTPVEAIADLDQAVASWGEDVILRRTTGTQQVPLDVSVRAAVRGYRPHELVGPIVQGDRRVILSPTEMQRAQWTWPPRTNDKCLIEGKQFTVQAVDPIKIAGALVRIELQVRG